MTRHRRRTTLVVWAFCALVPVVGLVALPNGDAVGATTATVSGPRPQYRCSFNVNTDAFTGAYGTASAIGWLGDHNSVITCLGGTFVVQDGPNGFFQNYGRDLRRPAHDVGRRRRLPARAGHHLLQDGGGRRDHQ